MGVVYQKLSLCKVDKIDVTGKSVQQIYHLIQRKYF